jgi:hypothetical protein
MASCSARAGRTAGHALSQGEAARTPAVLTGPAQRWRPQMGRWSSTAVLRSGACKRQVPSVSWRVANRTSRHAARPPAYGGHGRPPTRGLLVRPLPRKRKGHLLAATPADHAEVWSAGGQTFRADYWYELVLPHATSNAETFDVVVIYDPDYAEPLLLITSLRLAAAVLRDLYLDRWPIEQLPLAAKQLIGAERQWV